MRELKTAEDAEYAEGERGIVMVEEFENSSASPASFTVFIRIVTLACLVFVATTEYASRGPCGAEEGRLAEAEAVTLRTWDSLYQSYKHYENCDDGAIAEGYSESVARVLVDHWETLPRLAALVKSSPEFRAFVFKHVDSTLNSDNIKQIAKNAKTRCPAGLISLCNDLKKQAH